VDIAQIILIAGVAEAITQSAMWVIEKGWNKERITALVVAVVVCVGTGADLFAYIGAPIGVPYGTYIGAALTGVLAARGATVLHDLFGVAKTAKERLLLP